MRTRRTRIFLLTVAASLCCVSTARSQTNDSIANPDSKEGKSSDGKSGAFENDQGTKLRWGVDVAVLRLSVQRVDSQPAKRREYKTKLEPVPAEFGFFVGLDPHSQPWRLTSEKSTELQLLSPTAFILFGPSKPVEQSSMSIGIGMGFFDRTLMLGVSFDLYRGIPVLGADGVEGSGTAQTGLLAWAWTREGELTTENVALVVSLSAADVINALSGVEK